MTNSIQDDGLTSDQLRSELARARQEIAELKRCILTGAPVALPEAPATIGPAEPAIPDEALELASLIDVGAIQDLLDAFHAIIPLGLAIVDSRGKVLVACGGQDICLRFHRRHPETARNCRESDLSLSQKLRQGQIAVYKCKNNLWDVATPLYVGGRHVGAIYTGQFFYDDELIDENFFIDQARRYGFDRDDYLRTLRSTPRFSRQAIESVMNFLVKLASLVSEVGLRSLELNQSSAEKLQLSRHLSEQDNLLRTSLDITADGVLVIDRHGNITKMNAMFASMWNLAEATAPICNNDDLRDHCRKQARNPQDFLERVWSHKAEARIAQDEIELQDDRVLEYQSCPIIDGGVEIGRLWVFRDITTRKQAEAALRKSQQAYRNLFENAGVGMIRASLDGTSIQEVNQAFCDLLGYSRSEMLNMPVIKCWARPEERDAMVEILKQLGKVTNLEFSFCKKNGDERIGLLSMKLYRPQGAEEGYVEGSVVDITEHKLAQAEKERLQNQLFQAQKMESLGTLAGGIAHDFNNILTGIVGFGELALHEAQANPEAADCLNEVLKAAERARKLVRQILTFSRRMETEVVPVKPQQVALEALQLIRASIPPTVAIIQDLDAQAGTILADPSQFHQVIMNLCTNAYAAMPEGGSLTVKLKNCRIAAEDVKNYLDLESGPHICLSVSDTGCGMDLATIAHIFDPFFTTKPKGEGTGLGLATVHGIVKSLKGDITVYSEPGLGTTFNIYIPTAEATAGPQPAASAAISGRGEKILLVDDEESILKLGSLMLEKLGFTVSAHTSPQAALQAFKADPAAFSLVITDYAMPGMTGAQLTRAVLGIRPGMPIIVASGFAYEISESWLKDSGIATFVEKPFNRNSLCQAISKCLN